MNLAGGDLRAALDACRAAHGDAFVFGFGPIRFHWFLDQAGASFVLGPTGSAFANAGAYGFLEPIGGRTALIATDDPEHLRRRRLVQPAFHPQEVARWSELAADRFEPFVARALSEGAGRLLPAVRPIVLELVLDVLLGPAARRRHPRLAADVGRMMAFANQPMLAQLVRVPVPPAPWAAFVAARRRADAAIRAAARARGRAGDAAGSADVLSVLLARDGDPAGHMSEDELRDQALSLVSAGFDTTTAAIGWTMHLLTEPRLRDEVADELQASTPAEAARAPVAGAVLQESLRLFPPASAILRRARRSLPYGPHALPAGARVGVSTWHLHRDERLWRDPSRAEPARWLDRDGPWAAPRDAFAFLPFGYGGRYCIGAGLARTVVLAFVWAAVRRARWEAGGRPTRPVGTTLAPSDGLPLRWRAV